MITEPSPRMVLPENMAMWRRLGDIGFTTISSVWNTPSTTTPNVWLPICMTTMKPVSALTRRWSMPSSFFSCTSGSSLSRERSTGVSLMPLDAVLGAAARAHQFDHRKLRDGEVFAARLDDQRRQRSPASAES